MKFLVPFFTLFLICGVTIQAQTHTISGIVSDQETGEKLSGAYIYIQELNTGTVTNSFGFYSITLLNEKQVSIAFSYIGYKKQTIQAKLTENQTENIKLIQATELKEVTIQGRNNKSIQAPTVSTNTISVNQLKKLPSISGENDILLAFQMMPGVQGGNEGTGALFVRGGSADQNLYLIDDIPVYYVNHLGGYVSIFDENAINSVKLFKGGFPAQYNGKLSSILDIRLKDGNKKKIHGEIKLDILASKFFIEGPLLKKKATFMVSLRRCNLDLITRTLFRENGVDGKGVFGYTFIDFNSKINIPLSAKSTLSIFGYYGRDKMFNKFKGTGSPFSSPFTYEELWQTKWGNKLASIKWNRIVSNTLFASADLAYTSFNYQNSLGVKEFSTSTGNLTYENNSKTGSSINDFIAKFELDFYPVTKHKFKAGATVTNHSFSPNSAHFSQNGNQILDTIIGDTKINALEYNSYLSYSGQIGKRFSYNAGVNVSHYITDGLSFSNYQPRLITNAVITENLSFKISYSKMTQYSHLLSSSNVGMPTDMWLPATSLAKPENSNIFSSALVGFIGNFEITTEFFYKIMDNLIDFKESSNFNQNASWVDKIETNGTGKSYGYEFMIQKTSGKFSGWVTYTWSKTDRKFENINSGNSFPFKFDRRHDFSLLFNYKLSEKISLSATWVYSTGFPITIGIGQYKIQEIQNNTLNTYINNHADLFKIVNKDVVYIGNRNNYRMPAYHRLDIGAIFSKKKKHGTRQIKLGIYNVYNKQNPYFIYYEYDYTEKRLKLYQFSMFPIIPSISYSYTF